MDEVSCKACLEYTLLLIGKNLETEFIFQIFTVDQHQSYFLPVQKHPHMIIKARHEHIESRLLGRTSVLMLLLPFQIQDSTGRKELKISDSK